MAASKKRKNRSKKQHIAVSGKAERPERLFSARSAFPLTRRSRRRFRFNKFYAIVPVVVVLLIAGVWLLTNSSDGGDTGMAPVSIELPHWVRQGTSKAQQAYTQAVVHRDELRYIPCFCGCGPIGHQSVADCFVDRVSPDGAVIYDTHGFT